MESPPTKGERIQDFVDDLTLNRGWPPCYEAYFLCFNRGEYYEAHDVLEHLWLDSTGERYRYYKGLIQLAGAFVHLQKQHLRPDHPKDGARLAPAMRLFERAEWHLKPFAPEYLGFEVTSALQLGRACRDVIVHSAYRSNPWSPRALPQLLLRDGDAPSE